MPSQSAPSMAHTDRSSRPFIRRPDLVFIMNDEGNGQGRPVTLSEREVGALRVLRTLAQAALNRAADELVALGKQRELTRSIDALAVLDRLTGDAEDGDSREELQLEAIRVGTAAGYTVAFAPDGCVHFARSVMAADLYEIGNPVAAWLARLAGKERQ